LAKHPDYAHHRIPTERFDVKRIESSRNLSVTACLRQLGLELAQISLRVLVVQNTILTAGVTLACLLLIAQGSLQCFAPQKLKQVYDRLWPKGNYSSALFDKLREQQASPSLMYRFSGLILMGMGILMLMVGVFGLFRR
jgi:hypothetical protein